MKTMKQYKNDGLNRCPNCDSNNIQPQPYETNDDVITQENVCYDCNLQWVDRYLLQSYKVTVDAHESDTSAPTLLEQAQTWNNGNMSEDLLQSDYFKDLQRYAETSDKDLTFCEAAEEVISFNRNRLG